MSGKQSFNILNRRFKVLGMSSAKYLKGFLFKLKMENKKITFFFQYLPDLSTFSALVLRMKSAWNYWAVMQVFKHYLHSKLSFLFSRQETEASEESQLPQTFLLQYNLTTVDHDLSALETHLFDILTFVKVNKGWCILSAPDNTSLISNSMIPKRNCKKHLLPIKIYLEY